MADLSREDGFSFLTKLNWAKMVTWGIFLGLVYILQSLFTIIFLTFVISYIARNVVEAIFGLFPARAVVRKTIVVFTFLVFIFLVLLGSRMIAPHIYEQGRTVYSVVSDLSDRGEGDVDQILQRAYAGIRFMFFKTTDSYEEELEEFKKKKMLERDERGLEGFQEEAQRIRADFRALQVVRSGEEKVGEMKESGEYNDALDEAFSAVVEEKEYLTKKEELNEKMDQELRERNPGQAYEKLKDRYVDWDGFLRDRILEELIGQVKRDLKKDLKYEEEANRKIVENSGEGEVRILEQVKADWEAMFKEYYENLSSEKKDYSYDKFSELEKARDQKEYRGILGDLLINEEKLAADYRKEKEAGYVEGVLRYGFISDLSEKSKGELLPEMASWVAKGINHIVTFGFHLILSLFFSFIIVWDIPKLAGTVRKLENSRIKDFYKEIVPGLVSFGSLMGRAFQAQAIIAMMNTILTFTALTLFDVENRAFLSSIVFVCSFIPVVGVIISSVPIALIGMQQEGGGIILALELVGAIVVIHFIESTVLNPKVMGDMLKLHPLLVLIILLVGEHFFGIWGLLLGVPVCVYIFRYVILKNVAVKEEDPPAGHDDPPHEDDPVPEPST